jgi:hypothetical protein
MKSIIRLLLGFILGLFVVFLANMVMPSIGFVGEFVKNHNWLHSSDITQIVFLVVSLSLIYLFSRGNVETYGLKSVKGSEIVKPVLVSIIVSIVITGVGMVLVMLGGEGGVNGTDSIMGSGILKAIISVWIIASISEEVFFRGLLQGFLNPLKKSGINLFKIHISVPIIFSALFFGLGHIGVISFLGTNMTILIIINATILGFIAGYYREKTGSLIPAIVVHMTFNIVGSIIGIILTKIMTG